MLTPTKLTAVTRNSSRFVVAVRRRRQTASKVWPISFFRLWKFRWPVKLDKIHAVCKFSLLNLWLRCAGRSLGSWSATEVLEKDQKSLQKWKESFRHNCGGWRQNHEAGSKKSVLLPKARGDSHTPVRNKGVVLSVCKKGLTHKCECEAKKVRHSMTNIVG